jgi:hypothetical protein
MRDCKGVTKLVTMESERPPLIIHQGKIIVEPTELSLPLPGKRLDLGFSRPEEVSRIDSWPRWEGVESGHDVIGKDDRELRAILNGPECEPIANDAILRNDRRVTDTQARPSHELHQSP